MPEYVPIVKSEKEEPVPTEWRKILSSIVEAFVSGDFKLDRRIPRVRSLSIDEAKRIAGNIELYGIPLTTLPAETWNTSVCRWMTTYWEVLVDLFTEGNVPSDLVLFVRVYENGGSFQFEVESVNVP